MSSYLSQFNYQITGPKDGRPWVLLHGLMGSGMNWRRIAKGLEDTERVLVFDQRGHGKSWQPVTGYAAEDYADDVYLITQELGWNRFFLLGHSMGGRNALEFASKFPEKVEKLIIEDIGPESAESAPDYYRWLLGLVPTPFPSRLKAKEFLLNEFKGLIQGKTENPDTLGQYFYTNITEMPDGTADWRFSKEAIIASVRQGRAKDRWQELRNLSMPTLVIRGGRSRELSSEVFQRMIHANPRIEGVEISDAGHWAHFDQPEEFLKVIRKFTGLPS